jgi:predicted Zn-dependent protease
MRAGSLVAVVALGAVLFPIVSIGLDTASLQQSLNNAKGMADDFGKMAKGIVGVGADEENTIGGVVALEVVARVGKAIRDEKITERVNLIGKALARYSDQPNLRWRFAVLESDQINAFSAPAGYVFITRGLYDLLENDDLLAGVLGHEIVHIAKRHALRVVARNSFIEGAADFTAKRSRDFRRFETGIVSITNVLFEKGYDPLAEYEADREGQALATLAGFNPNGLRQVLEQLKSSTRSETTMFSTHPPLEKRIHRLTPGYSDQ